MTALKAFFARRAPVTGPHRPMLEDDEHIYDQVILPVDDARGVYHIGHKNMLARKLVEDYIKQQTPTIKFVLDRKLDMRLCSLMSYYFAREFFSSYGADFFSENREIAQVLGLELKTMSSGRLSDMGHDGSVLLPVKYRGFGYPLNSPNFIGQQFQINLCAFAEPRPRLAFLDWQQGNFEVIKGLKHIGTDGRWEIFEVDRFSTDDMTAIVMNDRRSDVRVEVAHLLPDGSMPLIYRFSNVEADIEL